MERHNAIQRLPPFQRRTGYSDVPWPTYRPHPVERPEGTPPRPDQHVWPPNPASWRRSRVDGNRIGRLALSKGRPTSVPALALWRALIRFIRCAYRPTIGIRFYLGRGRAHRRETPRAAAILPPSSRVLLSRGSLTFMGGCSVLAGCSLRGAKAAAVFSAGSKAVGAASGTPGARVPH